MTNTKMTMRNAAYDLDATKGSMNLNKVLIQDITFELERFSEEATEVKTDMAPFYLAEVQSRLRLLTALMQRVEKDMCKEHENLENISSYIFREVVEQPQAEQGSHVYPFIDTKKAPSVQG